MLKKTLFFFYKSVIIFCVVFFIYHITIGPQINRFTSFLKEMENFKTVIKDNQLKDKTRFELKKLIDKDRILYEKDSELIRKLIEKLKKEIYLNN